MDGCVHHSAAFSYQNPYNNVKLVCKINYKKVLKWLANHWCDMMSAWLIGPVWCQLRGANTQWQFQGCRPQCETVLGASFLLLLHFLLLGLIHVCLIFNNQKWNHRAIKVNKDILILSSVWIHMYSGYLACHKYLW